MNKYQREKAKRKKKLANLGLGYYQQKNILRKYSLNEVDTIIDQVTLLEKLGILEKIKKILVNIFIIEFDLLRPKLLIKEKKIQFLHCI